VVTSTCEIGRRSARHSATSLVWPGHVSLAASRAVRRNQRGLDGAQEEALLFYQKRAERFSTSCAGPPGKIISRSRRSTWRQPRVRRVRKGLPRMTWLPGKTSASWPGSCDEQDVAQFGVARSAKSRTFPSSPLFRQTANPLRPKSRRLRMLAEASCLTRGTGACL
jgi:hypothetical protein